jgi:hypothetical protein
MFKQKILLFYCAFLLSSIYIILLFYCALLLSSIYIYEWGNNVTHSNLTIRAEKAWVYLPTDNTHEYATRTYSNILEADVANLF